MRTLLALAAPGILSIASYASDQVWIVREDGVGPVKIGMTLSQLNDVLREHFVMPEKKEDQGCFYVNPARHHQISFMIEDGRLSRVDVDAPGISTVKGVEVGDSEKRAATIYGNELKVEPSQYTGPEGHYLTLRSKSGLYGIRFETEHGKITTYYAGRFESIQYVEGCQ